MWNNSYSFSEYSVKKVSTRQNGIVYNRLHCLPFQYISELKFTLSKNFPNISSIHFKSNQIKSKDSHQSKVVLLYVLQSQNLIRCLNVIIQNKNVSQKKTNSNEKKHFHFRIECKSYGFFFF